LRHILRTNVAHGRLNVGGMDKLDVDEIEELDEAGLEDRRRLIEHLNHVIFPGCEWWFIDQIVEAIELAADDEDDAWIEVDMKNRMLAEVIHDWELEELVEEAKAGRFKPRGGERMWRREPRREGELTQEWKGG
jgi:hypothetical protein